MCLKNSSDGGTNTNYCINGNSERVYEPEMNLKAWKHGTFLLNNIKI